jgi:YHS domain-containing protein
MEVDPKTAPATNYHNQSYFFCSEGCRDKFEADPGRYVSTDE